MNINEFIYDRGLSGSLNDGDKKYIENCISDISLAGAELYENALEFCNAVKALGENFENETRGYFSAAKEISLEVKKYNDSFSAEGIWSSVGSDGEKKKNLKRYYQHLERLDSLNGAILMADLSATEAAELKIRLANFEKAMFLYKLSVDFCVENVERFNDIRVALRKAADKLNEQLKMSLAMCKIRENNDKIFGEYLISLCNALDVKNKGEQMQVGLAKNSNISFIAAFKTEL